MLQFAGTGSTRLFTSQKATSLKPGRLPGFNIPPIEIGSTVLNGTRIGNRYGGSLVLSPAGGRQEKGRGQGEAGGG
jgi:hypothetical protein